MELVYLLAPGGTPIGMTPPLHETIVKQWRAGELTRVRPDGSPWAEEEDDPVSLADGSPPGEGQPAVPDGTGSEGEPPLPPVRPRDSAHKRDWQRYAAVLGACDAEEAAGMTRAALIDLVTPPEAKPPEA